MKASLNVKKIALQHLASLMRDGEKTALAAKKKPAVAESIGSQPEPSEPDGDESMGGSEPDGSHDAMLELVRAKFKKAKGAEE